MMVVQKCIEKVLHYYMFHSIFTSLLNVVMYSLLSLKKDPGHKLHRLRSFSLQVTNNPTQISLRKETVLVHPSEKPNTFRHGLT